MCVFLNKLRREDQNTHFSVSVRDHEDYFAAQNLILRLDQGLGGGQC